MYHIFWYSIRLKACLFLVSLISEEMGRLCPGYYLHYKLYAFNLHNYTIYFLTVCDKSLVLSKSIKHPDWAVCAQPSCQEQLLVRWLFQFKLATGPRKTFYKYVHEEYGLQNVLWRQVLKSLW